MPSRDLHASFSSRALARSLQLILFVAAVLGSQAAYAQTWPDCGFQCTAGDVTLQKVYLGDASGNPLPPCSMGSPTTGYLWMTIYNNANSPRYAVILLADIYIDGVLHGSTYPQGVCVLDNIQPKTTGTYKIYTLTWACGQEVSLRRMILSWETSGATCGSARRDCNNRKTKCNGGISVEVPANIPLSVNITTSAPQCCCGSITFTSTAKGGVPPYTYDWDFGDGTPHSTAQNTEHMYAMPGTYTALLTVRDSAGSAETLSSQVIIYARPQANITSSSPQCSYSAISFGGSATSGTAPYSYSWNFGDGKGSSTAQNPYYQYSIPGTYTVTLTVRDSNGCTDTISRQVTSYPAPIAAFSSNSPQCSPSAIAFKDATTGGRAPYTYSWNFGDGMGGSTAQNPYYQYASPGTYSVTLNVVDSNSCSNATTGQVTINPLPVADAGSDKSFIPGGPVTIGGSPTASGGLAPYSYSWSPASGLDDPSAGNPAASPAATTTYTVTVTDSRGCSAADNVTLYKSGLELSKQPSTSSLLVGETVTYTYIIRNTGDTSISISSLIDDKLGTISNINRTTLNPQESSSGSAAHPVTVPDLPGPIVNNATVSGTDGFGKQLSASASASVSLEPGLVHPILECVRANGDGTRTALFGYRNDGSESLTIPAGAVNSIYPPPADRGQPTVFLPGRHQFAFSINLSGDGIVWSIGGNTAAATIGSDACPIPLCDIEGPGTICTDTTGTYTSPGSEVSPFGYSYSWSFDGSYIGDQRIVNLAGESYSAGNHTLSVAIGESYNDVLVGTVNCSLAVTIEPKPVASINIINVQ